MHTSKVFKNKVANASLEELNAMRINLVVQQETLRTRFNNTRSTKNGDAYRMASLKLSEVNIAIRLNQ